MIHKTRKQLRTEAKHNPEAKAEYNAVSRQSVKEICEIRKDTWRSSVSDELTVSQNQPVSRFQNNEQHRWQGEVQSYGNPFGVWRSHTMNR